MTTNAAPLLPLLHEEVAPHRETIVASFIADTSEGYLIQAVPGGFRFLAVELDFVDELGEVRDTAELAARDAYDNWQVTGFNDMLNFSWGLPLQAAAGLPNRTDIIDSFVNDGLGFFIQKVAGGFRFVSYASGEDDELGDVVSSRQEAIRSAVAVWSEWSDASILSFSWGRDMVSALKAFDKAALDLTPVIKAEVGDLLTTDQIQSLADAISNHINPDA